MSAQQLVSSPHHEDTMASSSLQEVPASERDLMEPTTGPVDSNPPTSTPMSASTTSNSASESTHFTNDEDNLPPTKIKRKYLCKMCLHQTWNPREHFRHRIAFHNQKIRVVKCPLCVYACQYRQKLNRHLRLVHHILPHEIPKRFELNHTQSLSSFSQQKSSSLNQSNSQGSPYKPIASPHLTLDEINSFYSRLVPVKLHSSPVDLSFPQEYKQSIKILECILCLYGSQ